MPAPSSAGSASLAGLLAITVLTTAVRPVAAQAPDPTGGLRSRGMVPGLTGPGSSREELVRQWDLDGNGTIDKSEESIARSRMRRSRMQLELDGGIDPITGKPRVIADTEKPPAEPSAEDDPATDQPHDGRPPAAAEPALPGTRVPDIRAPEVGPTPSDSAGPAPAPSPASDATPSAAAEKRPGLPPRPTASAARTGSIIGGTRAGAPAARPGYGSLGPKPNLNAGIPLPDPSRPGSARGAGPRGGLVPSMRPPTSPRTAAPAAPSSRPPRVTADEIGGF